MHDKGGKAALMESETTHFDARTGAPLSRAVSGLFIRGLGGFASAGRTMSATLKRPSRAPDRVLELPTLLALLMFAIGCSVHWVEMGACKPMLMDVVPVNVRGSIMGVEHVVVKARDRGYSN